MEGGHNTLFLRVEGPLQAWGDTSKFVIRRTMQAPTKSGIFGLICSAEGLSRQAARERLKVFRKKLHMGVRIDRPGTRWWDYHTVGGGGGLLQPLPKGSDAAYQIGLLRADREGTEGIKKTATTGEIEALVTRREYLCDASFLIALQGEPGLIAKLEGAVKAPKWTLYLGRKGCPPSRPLLDPKHPPGEFSHLLCALKSVPWRPRIDSRSPAFAEDKLRGNDWDGDDPPSTLECLLDWEPTPERPEAPDDALIWYDVPRTFDPPSHEARFVIRKQLPVGANDGVTVGDPAQSRTPAPERIRTDYDKSTWGKIRDRRLEGDHHLCVFCKSPAVTGQHISYRTAGKEDNLAALADEEIMQERLKQVRSLCRLCHDAVTMIEYGLGMGLDRINPEDEQWRNRIIEKRQEIIDFRSLETRRRRLAAEEVE